MSYATPADVKALFRDFASNSEAAVGDVQIQAWLDTYSAQISARLKPFYGLPLTGSNPISTKLVAQAEAFYVAAIVDDILNNYSEADKKPAWAQRAEALLKSFIPVEDGKGGYLNPALKLPDATYLIEVPVVSVGGFRTQAAGSMTFRKGVDNW